MQKKLPPRKGYLLIFFSLVILMMFIPLWVRTVEQDLIVRQDIVKWNQYTQLGDILEGFNSTLMNLEIQKGPGYFNFQAEPGVNNTSTEGYDHGEQDRLAQPIQDMIPLFFENDGRPIPNADEYRLTYDYTAASVIPIPTTSMRTATGDTPSITAQKQLMRSRSANCHTYFDPLDPDSPSHRAYPNCDFTLDRTDTLNNKLTYTSDPTPTTSVPNEIFSYFYTVPTLGAGTAGDDCSLFALQLNDSYKNAAGDTIFVDPLDHPCNWNLMSKGQTVAIPLFTRDPKDPSIIRYTKPELLTLRLRFPCTTSQNFCDPKFRPQLNALGKSSTGIINDTTLNPSQWIQARRRDTSNKLIDYAIVDFPLDPTKPKTYYRPFSEFTNEYNPTLGLASNVFVKDFRVDYDAFIFRNYDLSKIRARFENDPTQIPREQINLYDNKNRITNLNLLSNITSITQDDFVRSNNNVNTTFPTNFSSIIRFRSLSMQYSLQNNFILFNQNQTLQNPINPDFRGQIYPSFTLGETLEATDLPELYFVFKFENFPLASDPIIPGYYRAEDQAGADPVNLGLNRMEWQLVSNGPVGLDKSFIRTQVKHPVAGWQNSKGIKSKRPLDGTTPRNTGTVFSN